MGKEKMNKIKEMILESKAIKYLGEDQYIQIKRDFTSTLTHLYYDRTEPESQECRQVLDEMKKLKNQIWVNTLFECLGGAMCGVALWRMGTYGLSQTILSCGVGLFMTAMAEIRSRLAKKEFYSIQDDFVEYIYSKMYGDYRVKYADSIEDSRDNSKYDLVACKSACNEMLD